MLYAQDGSLHSVVRRSNQGPGEELLMSDQHLRELGASLSAIHNRFQELYRISPLQDFAIEIEFKITAEGNLAIKQARPWVFESGTKESAQ